MRKLSDLTGAGEGGRARSELGLRVGSGLVMAALALVATWLGGPAFSAFWLAAAVAIAFEWMTITGAEPRSAILALCVAALVFCVVAYRLGIGWPLVGAALAAAAAALAILTWGRASTPWVVSGLAYAAIVALVPTATRDRPDLGAAAILWMFAVVWTTDVVAYFVGRRFGGPKLWPAVSPKKTWSGFLGGLAGGTAAGAGVWLSAGWPWSTLPAYVATVAAVSALASVASQAGDLMESAMKRRFSVKDSGRLIPGHGGVMDRLDGFVAVALLVGLTLAGVQLVER